MKNLEMNKQVLGYYDKTFDNKFFEFHKRDADDLVGSRLKLCFSKIESINEIGGALEKEKTPDDIIEEMLSLNESTLVEYDKNTQIAKIMFDHKIPSDIFDKYYGLDKEKIIE